MKPTTELLGENMDKINIELMILNPGWMVSPVYEQVLLHAEALRASVAVEAVVGAALLGSAVVALALALRQLRQLVLGGAEGPRLLPDARRVDHQAVLKRRNPGNEEG